MTDSPSGGFADTPGAESTPEQDAEVRSLLAFLRDEPVAMPPDVELRLYAVLAEERRSAAPGAGAAAAALGGSDDEPRGVTPGLAPVTVLPERPDRRRPSTRVLQVVGGLAAAAVVVIGAVTVLGHSPGGSYSATSTAGSDAARAAAGQGDARASATRVTASGTRYTRAALPAQVAALVAATRTATTASGAGSAAPEAAPTPAGGLPQPSARTPGGATGSPASSAVPQDALASLQAAGSVSACVARLTGGTGALALAIDAGTYDGRPALVVVLPTAGDPTSLDVFVATPDCSPSFLEYEHLPAR